MDDYVIITEGLRKSYNGFEAVRGVSFRVRRGTVYGLLGPNGAGKTTTIGMLTTIIKPSGGRALVAGFDVTRDPQRVREHIGVVFQEPTVDRDLTAWQNMLTHGLIHGLPRRLVEQRIPELLDLVGLREHAHRPLKSYSGGMIRRLEIARALLNEPDVVFLDEPTIGLDPQARMKVWEVIDKLRRSGVTVFLTTHYMDEAERLCDRIAIIDHGRIIAEGSPEELKSMVGGDTVYVKLPGRDAAEKLASLLRERGLGEDVSVAGDMVAVVARDAPRLMPRILSLAQEAGIRVLEARYTRPSLNDVFVKLTGRSLRDEEGDWRDFLRLHIHAGRRAR
ncbi:ABC transporter ATP-binding protein [Pyrodictium occultum]|uniref:ABC transporter ATP-binding protein n=1 Tax=Pyrodictium occultum TaxID=2309 RepID=A0A0V8RWX8_PYROC|nr:ATP-binding cassette domain-containing protein [Pyrodictium occultum]KSW12566.1 ABC transporter ATP-binding protein [Pyrodictium occultum]